MPSDPPTRAEQRAASEAAILDAAVELYASAGPSGVSLREIAGSAGLTHALVARYFGSKDGLVSAVEDRVAVEVRSVLETSGFATVDAFAGMLTWAHDNPTWVKLVVRSGLGDLDPTIVPNAIGERCAAASSDDERSRLCGYGAANLMLGWLAWNVLLVPALGIGGVSRRRRHAAIAGATASLLELATRPQPALESQRPLAVRPSRTVPADQSARDALLDAAVELFAEHGPASVSIRDVARHAGVNHGLVHRHFGSKDDLLAAAVDAGGSSVLTEAFAADGFDLDGAFRALHHGSPTAKTMARVVVDNIAIGTFRTNRPGLRQLVDYVRRLPADARPPALADPRLAAAAATSLAVGSVIWGPHLRQTFNLGDEGRAESAMAALTRWLLGAPDSVPGAS
jgi:AcrR family transcriptional regulator